MTTDLIKPKNELILPRGITTAAKGLEEHMDRLLSLLPSGKDAQAFAANVIASANDLTEDCKWPSVMKAALNAARLGLPVGGPLGLAYFVPFKGECTLIIGYRGFIDLAFDGGFLRDVSADVVLRGEEFRQWTDESGKHFRHEPDEPFERNADRSNVVGAYCVYQNRRGGSGFRFIGRKEIDKADRGEKTKTGKPSVWGEYYAEMCMKTAVRRAAKNWKLTPQLALAVQLDEQAERGEPQSCDVPISENGQQPTQSRLARFQDPATDDEPGETTEKEPATVPNYDELVEILGNCTTPGMVQEVASMHPDDNYWQQQCGLRTKEMMKPATALFDKG